MLNETSGSIPAVTVTDGEAPALHVGRTDRRIIAVQRSDRDAVTGRFTMGNTCGQVNRWRLGQSGNPGGRPRPVDHYAEAIAATNPTADALRLMMNDLAKRPREREAARRLLVTDLVDAGPVPGSTPDQAYRKYRQFFRKGLDQLAAILLRESDTPDRREGARLRLVGRWGRYVTAIARGERGR